MKIISNPSSLEIKLAASALKNGNLVAFPTETVYGLGADATNEKSVSRIYSVKGRPINHPLIVHISSIHQMDIWATNIPKYAFQLASDFWPGSLTLVLKRSTIAKNYITGGQDTIGLRVPAHPVAIALLSEFDEAGGFGIAAPSANRFGAVSPTTSTSVYEDLEGYLGSKDLILDGGESRVGIESTIVDCTKSTPRILRPGAVTLKMLEATIKLKVSTGVKEIETRAPGLLSSHYSPKATVVLNSIAVRGDGLLAMKSIPTPTGVIRLASPENVEEYARILYETLRAGDRKGLKKIVIVPPNGGGIAEAIRDRLSKAESK
jgi:L-threonylcarbamoyladenylate synthase